MFEPSSSFF